MGTVFWLLDMLSCRLQDTCSVMTENPYKAIHVAHKMTTAVLRFAWKEFLMLHGEHPYCITLLSPRFCNVCIAVSHLSLCILTSSKAAIYYTFIFDTWDPPFLLLFWEKMSSPLQYTNGVLILL